MIKLLIDALASIPRYLNAMMGGNAYVIYCDHVRRYHPDQALPSEKEFWCQKWAEQDRNPGARCC